jgi:hypothetical protein
LSGGFSLRLALSLTGGRRAFLQLSDSSPACRIRGASFRNGLCHRWRGLRNVPVEDAQPSVSTQDKKRCMNSKNETCVQRILFLFYFSRASGLTKGEAAFLKNILAPKTDPGKVRAWKEYLATRLERIAGMMDVLLAAHADWAITERKDHFQMETVSFALDEAEKTLRDHGFGNEEYILKVEYTRKWGVL